MCMNNFYNNLTEGKKAERYVASILADYYNGRKIIKNVSDEVTARNKGDLLLTNICDGKEYYCDVKNDSLIWKSGNFFIEEKIERKDSGITEDGWIHKDYDILIVLDRVSNKIYILNCKRLREIYKNISEKCIRTWNSDEKAYNTGYLLKINTARRNGLIFKELDYDATMYEFK